MFRLTSAFFFLLIVFTASFSARGQAAGAAIAACDKSKKQTLWLSAHAQEGKSLDHLQATDLSLSENKTARQILSLEKKTDQPLSVVILIDTSMSQESTLDGTKLAAQAFIQSILKSGQDGVAIVSFTGNATIEQDLTNDTAKLTAALNEIQPAKPLGYIAGVLIAGTPPKPSEMVIGSTAIWDAIWATTEDILKSTKNTRRAIVLLSDGEDTFSRTKFREALEYAAKNEVTIFSVGIANEKYYGLNRDKLKKVAEETGGRAFFPKKVAELADILAQTERNLRSPYLLTYCGTQTQPARTAVKLKLEITNKELKQSGVVLSYRRYGL